MKILTIPEFKPLPSEPASIDEGLKIADQLSVLLTDANQVEITGIGLAAPQIGINKSVFVSQVPDECGNLIQRRFINPVILELKKPVRFTGEGCLSFPDTRCITLRYAECTVSSLEDVEGIKLVGLSAICAQHETDHLLGLTMYDRRISEIGPNTKCPCGSDKKYKKCCALSVVDFDKAKESLDVKF